jgi:hypothetical protein
MRLRGLGAGARVSQALLVPWLLAGCARVPAAQGPRAPGAELPAFALPHAEVMDPSKYRATDVIPYRQLTREDFRGTAPPAQVAAHADAAGAFTCGNIVPLGAASSRFDPTRKPGIYVGRFENAAFHAQMDRGCSWWNDGQAGLPSAYVLEHEQIHFALTEIAARHLTAAVRAERVETSAQRGDALLRERYDAILQEAMKELLRTNTAFDRDTSGRYEPERQREWLERVQRELGQTAAP